MRLTKKEKGWYGWDNDKKAFEKLSQLEDIEEELNLDLRIFLTLLKERKAWFLDINGKPRRIYFYDLPSLYGKEKYIKGCIESSTYYFEQNFYFKDYGKTWALDKKELDK